MLRHACARGLRQLARRAAALPPSAQLPPPWTPAAALRAFAAAGDESGSPAVRVRAALARRARRLPPVLRLTLAATPPGAARQR